MTSIKGYLLISEWDRLRWLVDVSSATWVSAYYPAGSTLRVFLYVLFQMSFEMTSEKGEDDAYAPKSEMEESVPLPFKQSLVVQDCLPVYISPLMEVMKGSTTIRDLESEMEGMIYWFTCSWV